MARQSIPDAVVAPAGSLIITFHRGTGTKAPSRPAVLAVPIGRGLLPRSSKRWWQGR